MTDSYLDFAVKLTASIVPREPPPNRPRDRKTAADYKSGEHRHNAVVFIDLGRESLKSVNDHGIELGGSGGFVGFRYVVHHIRKTDTFSKLNEVDYAEAAAMVFHLLPATEME